MNSKRGSISFEVGGASHSARLSTNSMVRYQDETGESIMDAFASMDSGRPDMKRLRALLWVCIEGDHSQEDVGDIMDEMGFPEVGRVLGLVAKAAFPQAEEPNEASTSGNGKAGKKTR